MKIFFTIIISTLIVSYSFAQRNDFNIGGQMPITWKQQHINNSCVPACLSMLLSQHGFQKEDRDIIHESLRPYLVDYDEDRKAYTAGILIQTKEVMSIVPNKYGFDLVDEMYTDFNEYWKLASDLSSRGISFLTSLPQGFIPAKGYEQTGSTRGHAVVVEKIVDDMVYILDPDGGIDRSYENCFEDVQELVSYEIPKAEFKKIISHRERFIIGRLEQISGGKTDIDSLLMVSMANVKGYAAVAVNELENVTVENGLIGYDDFFDFIIRILKPFVMDLRLALDTIPNKTAAEAELIELLQTTFDETRRIQIFLKDNPEKKMNIDLSNLCESLEEIESKTIKLIKTKIKF